MNDDLDLERGRVTGVDGTEEIAQVCLLVLGRVFFLQPDTDNSGDDNSQC